MRPMTARSGRPGAGRRQRAELRADCTRCAALCCVALGFAASADFADDKPSGQPCRHLGPGFACTIHGRLRQAGYGGCAAFDCLGAGQQVTQVTFGGRDWRSEPAIGAAMFAAFAVMRQLHELLWHLSAGLALRPGEPLAGQLGAAWAAIEPLTRTGPGELARLDVAGHHAAISPLLQQLSEQVRERSGSLGADLRGADLAGRDLAGADLRRASLRGSVLIGAILRDADLRGADLAGADLRGADLAGADLRAAIFLGQPQVDSALGDDSTRLPADIGRPRHWGSGRPASRASTARTAQAAPPRPQD